MSFRRALKDYENILKLIMKDKKIYKNTLNTARRKKPLKVTMEQCWSFLFTTLFAEPGMIILDLSSLLKPYGKAPSFFVCAY